MGPNTEEDRRRLFVNVDLHMILEIGNSLLRQSHEDKVIWQKK